MTDGPALPGNGVRRRAVMTIAATGAALSACSVPAPRRATPPRIPRPAGRSAGTACAAHADTRPSGRRPVLHEPGHPARPRRRDTTGLRVPHGGRADGCQPDSRPARARRRTGRVLLGAPPGPATGVRRPCSGWRGSPPGQIVRHRARRRAPGRGQHPDRRGPPGRADLPRPRHAHRPPPARAAQPLARPQAGPAHRRRRGFTSAARRFRTRTTGSIDVIAGLLVHYRPTVVHTLDPDPDIQHSTEEVRAGGQRAARVLRPRRPHRRGLLRVGGDDPPGRQDVRGTARRIPGFVVASFRGYYNRHWPKNLPPGVLDGKAAAPGPLRRLARLGLRQPVRVRRLQRGRRPAADQQEGLGPLHPSPLSGRTRRRRRRTRTGGSRRTRCWGSAWSGGAGPTPPAAVWGPPRDLGGGPLAPALGSAATGDGGLLLFGLRFAALSGHGADNEPRDRPAGAAHPGGRIPRPGAVSAPPPRSRDDRGGRIGVPVAVTAPDGRVHLFVRNAEKGSAPGYGRRTGSWERVAGPGRRRGPGRSERRGGRRGRVHVYAAGHHAVHHWTQDAPGAGLTAPYRRSRRPAPVTGDDAIPARPLLPPRADAPPSTSFVPEARPARRTTGRSGRERGARTLTRLRRGTDELDPAAGPAAGSARSGTAGRCSSSVRRARGPRVRSHEGPVAHGDGSRAPGVGAPTAARSAWSGLGDRHALSRGPRGRP